MSPPIRRWGSGSCIPTWRIRCSTRRCSARRDPRRTRASLPQSSVPLRCQGSTPDRSASEVLGLSADETDRLIADGVRFHSTREPMMDPRTPVLIGYGQVNQHDENPERGTGRPDGVGCPRRCRSTRAGGRRLRARGQPAVLAVPRSGTASGTAHQGRRCRHALHGHRRKRAADAGQQGVPGHPGGPIGRRTDRGSRDMAHPFTSTEAPEPNSTGPARTIRFRSPKVPTKASNSPARRTSESSWTVPRTSIRCSSRRCGSRRANRRTTIGVASANSGHSSARWRRRTRTHGAERRCRPTRSPSPARAIGWSAGRTRS